MNWVVAAEQLPALLGGWMLTWMYRRSSSC
jgi:hypothetical protein